MRLRRPLPAVQGDTLHIVGVGDNRIGKHQSKYTTAGGKLNLIIWANDPFTSPLAAGSLHHSPLTAMATARALSGGLRGVSWSQERAQGLLIDIPNSCRSGICHTCVCELTEGAVEYRDEPLDAPDRGQVLICCATLTTDLVLDV